MSSFRSRSGGSLDGKDVEAVVEVGAESSLVYGLLEVPVGRRDDPDVHPERAGPSDPIELPLLEDPQESGLYLEGGCADLIQEDGATVGHLEASGLPRGGPRERSPLVPEELSLHEARRKSGAVHVHQYLMTSCAGLVKRPRHQLLAGPGFTQNEDRVIGGSNGLDVLEDLLHGRGGSDEPTRRKPHHLSMVPGLHPELLDLCLCLDLVGDIPEDDEKELAVPGLRPGEGRFKRELPAIGPEPQMSRLCTNVPIQLSSLGSGTHVVGEGILGSRREKAIEGTDLHLGGRATEYLMGGRITEMHGEVRIHDDDGIPRRGQDPGQLLLPLPEGNLRAPCLAQVPGKQDNLDGALFFDGSRPKLHREHLSVPPA